jgi:hypothetical protein
VPHGHNWKTWVLGIVAIGCAGCGAPLHKDYAEADSAKLRVVLNDPKGYFLWASVIAPSSCKQVEVLWPLGGDNKPDPARVGMLDPKPVDNSNSETRIPARKTILRFSSLATVDAVDVLFAMTPTTQAEIRARTPSKCPVAEFEAESGQQYEIEVTVGPQRCDVAVYQLSEAQGNLDRRPVALVDSACPAK